MKELHRRLLPFAQKENIPVERIERNIIARNFTEKDEIFNLMYFQEDAEINPFLILMTKYYEECPNFRRNFKNFGHYGLQTQLLYLYYGVVNLGEKKELPVDFKDIIKRLDSNLARAISRRKTKIEKIKKQLVNICKYDTMALNHCSNDLMAIEVRIGGLCYMESLLDIINANEDEKEILGSQELIIFTTELQSDQYHYSLFDSLEKEQKFIDEIVEAVLTNFDQNEVEIEDLWEMIDEALMNEEQNFENAEPILQKKEPLQLAEGEQSKKIDFEKMAIYLKENIVGQDSQIEQVVRRWQVLDFSGIKETGAKGVFLFAGPTGVGKTETAKLLSKYADYQLIRMDMSEYKESHSVSKIHGSPPGYVGYDDGNNKVFDRVAYTPQAIILLDEIEKAHPQVLDLFLHIFDEGKARDNRQKEIDFSEVIFVLTTNIGAFEASKSPIGFANNLNKAEAYQDAIESRLLPEFINRIDEIVYFRHLEKENIYDIIDMCLDKIEAKFVERGYDYQFHMQPAALEQLISEINYEKYGARDVLRVLSDRIIPPLMALDLENKNAQLDIDFEEDIVVNQTKTLQKTKTMPRKQQN